jgi:serine/threonine-protein kinase HipA
VRDKYDGSAELCVRLLGRYASEPLIEIQKLYRLILFSWWTANGDMHLKNFSLLTTPEGIRRLSPAYDLVCTKLAIPEDTLAMPVGGRDSKLTRRKWVEFGEYCQIPAKATKRLIAGQIEALDPALHLIAASFLPDRMKEQYEAILRENTAVLAS